MIKKRLRVVLFGPQGCGKGTQGRLLADRFDVPFISTGELLREEVAEATSMGSLLQAYVDQGLLAPDDLVNAVVLERLQHLDLSRGFVLDGFPRNVDQAHFFDRHHKITLAVSIRISDKESLRRLLGRLQCARCGEVYHVRDAPPIKSGVCTVCGAKLAPREDDNEEAIRRRLATYHFMTEPLASYYRQHGVLLVVNGEQPIPYVFDDLVKKMAKLGFVA